MKRQYKYATAMWCVTATDLTARISSCVDRLESRRQDPTSYKNLFGQIQTAHNGAGQMRRRLKSGKSRLPAWADPLFAKTGLDLVPCGAVFLELDRDAYKLLRRIDRTATVSRTEQVHYPQFKRLEV